MRAIEPGERVRLEDPAEAFEMARGMLAGTIPREVQQRRRRVAPAEGPVVTHVDPGPPGRGLAVGQHGRAPGTECRRRARARPPTHGRAGPLNEGPTKSRAAADLIRQAQGHALAGVALRSTPSASVTTLRRPARPGRARLLLPGESVSNAHRVLRVGPALATPWGDAPCRIGLPVGLQSPASTPLHSVERQFTGFHEGARRPSTPGTCNSAYPRAVPFTRINCSDSSIQRLPRLGSRVRIPSPAPKFLHSLRDLRTGRESGPCRFWCLWRPNPDLGGPGAGLWRDVPPQIGCPPSSA